MTILQEILPAVNWDVRVNENFQAVSPAGLFGRKASTTTGLTLGYYGGILDGVSYADGTHALTASTTRYVVVERATGVVSSATGTTNWNDSTNYMRMGVAVVGSSTITTWTDWREAYAAGGGGGGMTNPMTTAGDTIVGGVAGAPARLAAGATSGHVLTSNGAGVAPSWQAPSGGGGGSGDVAWYQPSQMAYLLTNNDKTAQSEFTGGSLHMQANSALNAGLKYFEVYVDAVGTALTPMIGIAQLAEGSGEQLGGGGSAAARNTGWGVISDGRATSAGSYPSYGVSFTTGDTIGVAVNFTTGKIWFAKNNTWMNSGDPVADTGEAFSNIVGYCRPAVSLTTAKVTAHFKTADLTYSPPTGFTAWQ